MTSTDVSKFVAAVTTPQDDDNEIRVVYRGLRIAVDKVLSRGLSLAIFAAVESPNADTLTDAAMAIYFAGGDLSELAAVLD